MTKEQVLSANLSESEKAMVNSIYLAQTRFKKTSCSLDKVKSETELHILLASMEAKRQKKKSGGIPEEITRTVKDALKEGLTEKEICDSIKTLWVSKHNKAIEAQIQELKSKLL